MFLFYFYSLSLLFSYKHARIHTHAYNATITQVTYDFPLYFSLQPWRRRRKNVTSNWGKPIKRAIGKENKFKGCHFVFVFHLFIQSFTSFSWQFLFNSM